MYSYKDFATGKVKHTRGKFAGWTGKTGLLNVRYAIFSNRAGDVLVPEYCLTPATKEKIKRTSIERGRR